MVALLTAPYGAHAQDVSLDWAASFGGAADDHGTSIAVDAAGNAYTIGFFAGTVDFDPGDGVFNLTSEGGGFDIFVTKLDTTGNLLWAKAMGGLNDEDGPFMSITVDATGNVYTTGRFSDTADFDPGDATFNLVSERLTDIFVSKLDANGNFVWAKRLGGPGAFDTGTSIAVDDSGVYTTGIFQGDGDFDPGFDPYILNSAGGIDIYISKLDLDGNFMWAKRMGGSSGDHGQSIALDDSGNIYTTGMFAETVDFNPGDGFFNLTSKGDFDIFVQKLDSAGDFQWTAAVGGSATDEGLGIAVDLAGNVYTTGIFTGTVDFNPGGGPFNLISAGLLDIFVSKLNEDGEFVWAKAMGGTEDDFGKSIAVDVSGNAYTTGYFRSTADFNPGAQTFNLNAAAGRDIFVSKLSASGDFVWAKGIGAGGTDEGNSIAVDGQGNVYTTGRFDDTVDFDPGPGTVNLTSISYSAAFVIKLATDTPGAGLVSISGLVSQADMMETPLACATVLATNSGGEIFVAPATQDGRYAFIDLPPDDYDLEASSPGLQRGMDSVSAPEGGEFVIDFALATGTSGQTFVGEVTAADTGALLAGVQVDLFVDNILVDTTFTCAEGRYEVRVPSAAKGTTTRIDYTAEGFDPKSIEDPDPVEDTVLEPKDLFPGVIVGLVINRATDEVVPDAQVFLRPTGGVVAFTFLTNPSGLFTHTNAGPGDYEITVHAGDFDPVAVLHHRTGDGISNVTIGVGEAPSTGGQGCGARIGARSDPKAGDLSCLLLTFALLFYLRRTPRITRRD